MEKEHSDSLTVLTSIAHRTLSSETYLALKRSILRLELAPGAPIDEARVALRLGVSKTPVREAIARLEGERLVMSISGKGSYVAAISPQTVREMLMVRRLLEATSLRDSTLKLSDADIQRVGQLVDAGDIVPDTTNVPEFVNWNERFHTVLIQFSDNQYLTDSVNTLLDQSRRVAFAILRSEHRTLLPTLMRETVERHTSIHTALTRRDAAAAAALMSADIDSLLHLVDQPCMQAAFAALSAPRKDEG